MKFRTFRGIREFLEEEWVGPDPGMRHLCHSSRRSSTNLSDEGEYSWHLLTQTNLTFLRFPAMVANHYHLSTTSNPFSSSALSSVYGILDDYKWSTQAHAHIINPSNRRARATLAQKVHDHKSGLLSAVPPTHRRRASYSRKAIPKLRKTFSDKGKEYEVALRIGAYQGHLWYPQRYAVDFVRNSSPAFNPPVSLKYVLRREPHGPMYHRAEPLDAKSPFLVPISPGNYDMTMGQDFIAIEMMYNHFQNEKYKRKFIFTVVQSSRES